MIDTADNVAERYKISREAQDAYALESQRRTATAQQAKRFDSEIVPLPTTKKVIDKKTNAESFEQVTLTSDEGNRPDTTLEGLAALKPVREGSFISAGNASQLSDGASACVVMDAKLAEKRGLEVLGTFRGFAVAGCEPDEMGIGPVFAVPKLLARHGLKMDDIDLWELNEAFASQVLYCRDRLGIPQERLNVNGGAIAIGHPFGMSGARMTGHALIEGAGAAPSAQSSPCASAAAWAPPACSRSIRNRAMDLRFTPDEIAFRDEVRAFMRSALPAAIRDKMIEGRRLVKDDLVTWQRILNAKGWAVPHWPKEWGGTGWEPVQIYLFRDEMQQAPAPEPLPFGVNMVGPVIIAFGNEAQKKRFLPRIANLDDWWCQGFSEPGAGSDLASLKTTAKRDGAHYIVNGQKTWTTLAQYADWIFCLVRTDADRQKAGGHFVSSDRHENAGHHRAADPDHRWRP